MKVSASAHLVGWEAANLEPAGVLDEPDIGVVGCSHSTSSTLSPVS
jgi:hypothetical protein